MWSVGGGVYVSYVKDKEYLKVAYQNIFLFSVSILPLPQVDKFDYLFLILSSRRDHIYCKSTLYHSPSPSPSPSSLLWKIKGFGFNNQSTFQEYIPPAAI